MTVSTLLPPGRPAGSPGFTGLSATEARFEVVTIADGIVEARLRAADLDPPVLGEAAIAFVEGLTAQDAAIEAVRVRAEPEAALDVLVERVAGRSIAGRPDAVDLLPDLVWQLPGRWLAGEGRPYPELRTVTAGRGHPLRPPKPRGTVYRRAIPWLGAELTFRAAGEAGDAALLNAWMNQPRVAAIWDEAGPVEHHRAYLDGLIADPHILPLIGLLDGRPFGWFEVYYAVENRLGALYAAADWDRGWHVAIGDEDCRGAAHVSAWLPSLMHFLFLDEPRTRRIVGEPRADHRQQLRNLERSGFAAVGTVDFPHKRAALVMLTRERFFRDHLWAPGAAEASLAGTPRAR